MFSEGWLKWCAISIKHATFQGLSDETNVVGKSTKETIFIFERQMYCLPTHSICEYSFESCDLKSHAAKQTRGYPSRSMGAYHLASGNLLFCWI